MAECRFEEHNPLVCITHISPRTALCFIGKAELEERLRGDIESIGQEVIRLESRLRAALKRKDQKED